MRAADPRELERAFRDMPLVDRHNHSCGVVDDIEIRKAEDDVFELAALLVGPGAWRRRRPRWLTAHLPVRHMVRIDAADVASTTSVVRLARGAAELGLATLERRLLR